MEKKAEMAFLALSARTIETADGIKCSKKDYVEGLELLISDLETSRDATQDETDAEDEE